MRVGLVRKVALGMVVLVGLGLSGCDDVPTEADFDVSETVKITTNPSVMIVPADVTTLLTSRTENQGNEPTWEDISPTVDSGCATTPQAGTLTIDVAANYEPAIQPPGVFDVTGGTTWGETCINLSGGGASKTVEVTVVPDSLEITGAVEEIRPATGVTTVQLSANLLSDLGAAVTPFDPTTDLIWVSDNEDALTVDETGLVTATGPGSAQVTATWALLGDPAAPLVSIEATTAGIAVLVPPPVLTSTDVASAEPLETVTVTGTDLIPGFHTLFLNGLPVESTDLYPAEIVDATTATFVMPPQIDPENVEVTIGVPGDVSNALEVTFVCGSFVDCPSEPNQDPFSAETVLLPFSGTGIVDPDDVDDFFLFDLAVETTLQLDLSWTGDSGDMDLLVVDAGFTAFQCGFVTATASVPESGQCTLPAGSYAIWVNGFDEQFAVYDVSVTIVP